MDIPSCSDSLHMFAESSKQTVFCMVKPVVVIRSSCVIWTDSGVLLAVIFSFAWALTLAKIAWILQSKNVRRSSSQRHTSLYWWRQTMTPFDVTRLQHILVATCYHGSLCLFEGNAIIGQIQNVCHRMLSGRLADSSSYETASNSVHSRTNEIGTWGLDIWNFKLRTSLRWGSLAELRNLKPTCRKLTNYKGTSGMLTGVEYMMRNSMPIKVRFAETDGSVYASRQCRRWGWPWKLLFNQNRIQRANCWRSCVSLCTNLRMLNDLPSW